MILKSVGIGDLQIEMNQHFYIFVKDFHYFVERIWKKRK